MELRLQIVPGVVEVGPGLLHPVAASFHCATRSWVTETVPSEVARSNGSLRAGGPLSVIRAVDVDLELQIVLQHVGRIEHLQSNRGPHSRSLPRIEPVPMATSKASRY